MGAQARFRATARIALRWLHLPEIAPIANRRLAPRELRAAGALALSPSSLAMRDEMGHRGERGAKGVGVHASEEVAFGRGHMTC